MSLLTGTDALGFPIDATDAGSATLGLSELGTNMARGMIKETKPTRFYDLVQLMGLSHGTDVWTGMVSFRLSLMFLRQPRILTKREKIQGKHLSSVSWDVKVILWMTDLLFSITFLTMLRMIR